MGDLRAKIENDLVTTLEGRFGLPVELTGPDGSTQTQKAGDPESLLQGQVIYDTLEENPETGELVVLEGPVVTLRRTSLDAVPEPGEFWHVRIPSEPRADAPMEDYVLSTDHPPRGCRSIGFIRLYLTKPKQSS